MKKLIYSLFVVLSSTTSFAQNEELHNAKIIGSYELGTQEITTIFDEVTGCERKTSPHSKDLFIPNETVQIKISGNKQMAEVIKQSLPEQVFTNKKCGFSVSNAQNPYDVFGTRHNELVISFVNDVVIPSAEQTLTEVDVYEYLNTTDEVIDNYNKVDGMANANVNQYTGELKSLQIEYPLLFNEYKKIRSIITNNGLSFELKIEKIKQFERSIINNSNALFSGLDDSSVEQLKSGILTATAIGRYSLYLWTSTADGGLGYYDIINPPLAANGPPDWVVEDIWGAFTSALFTWNPWAALGGGVAASVVKVVRDNF